MSPIQYFNHVRLTSTWLPTPSIFSVNRRRYQANRILFTKCHTITDKIFIRSTMLLNATGKKLINNRVTKEKWLSRPSNQIMLVLSSFSLSLSFRFFFIFFFFSTYTKQTSRIISVRPYPSLTNLYKCKIINFCRIG